MRNIPVGDRTGSEIELLARAWKVTEGEVVDRLLDEFRRDRTPGPAVSSGGDSVPVHAVYREIRVEGAYNPASLALTITKGPGEGHKYRSPSAAAIAVVSALNPSVSPNRNGWGFWTVTSTGKRLQSIRDEVR
ncbi:hypothetical protein GCM10022235_84000 [Kribbella ginsengisoli]|uniref:Uncharacterized protein n=1 Tax=Kribbella ginsengisoli TaxID=363865 RepID=A0ABP6ZBF5_9ACTN